MPEQKPEVSSKGLSRRLQRLKALELRARGWSFQKIADELGVAWSSARYIVGKAEKDLAKQESEALELLRRRELLGMQHDEKLLDDIASNDKVHPRDRVAAVNGKTNLRARRAALLGLDLKQGVDGTTINVMQLFEQRPQLAGDDGAVVEAALDPEDDKVVDAEAL